jgi:hypothetical protein
MKLVFVVLCCTASWTREVRRQAAERKNGKRSETSPSRDLGAAGPDHTVLSQLQSVAATAAIASQWSRERVGDAPASVLLLPLWTL